MNGWWNPTNEVTALIFRRDVGFLLTERGLAPSAWSGIKLPVLPHAINKCQRLLMVLMYQAAQS
eukprot:scaffold52398_cov18-Tisochrysis_lutea.AAC.2